MTVNRIRFVSQKKMTPVTKWVRQRVTSRQLEVKYAKHFMAVVVITFSSRAGSLDGGSVEDVVVEVEVDGVLCRLLSLVELLLVPPFSLVELNSPGESCGHGGDRVVVDRRLVLQDTSTNTCMIRRLLSIKMILSV